jgi:hypothetical protein
VRTTYDKTVNVILVELSQEEVEKYCATELSTNDVNLRKVDSHYELQIPCSTAFYQMTQRQKGGDQPWGPNELRQAVRAAVANNLVPWDPDCVAPELFKNYKDEWNKVFQGLLRNVRLKFPNRNHPRNRLSRQDFQFRRDWRRMHVQGER